MTTQQLINGLRDIEAGKYVNKSAVLSKVGFGNVGIKGKVWEVVVNYFFREVCILAGEGVNPAQRGGCNLEAGEAGK